MEIGILTFHRAHNYGAFLQCYALQHTLTSLGSKTFVIDYEPSWIKSAYNWFNLKSFKQLPFQKQILYTTLTPLRFTRYKAFNLSIKKFFNLDPNINNICHKYDCIIVGSDQVWNIRITKGVDYLYWGTFKTGSKPLLIAYAPSMEIIEENQIIYKELFKNFDSISAREQKLADFIYQTINCKVPVVLDPTLLQDKEFWLKFAHKRLIKQKYLLLYQPQFNIDVYNYAKIEAQKKGLKLIALSSGFKGLHKNSIIGASPQDFISLFLYADYIITTSFHGTAFSVNFNKPFETIVLKELKNNRSYNLLSNLNLLNRLKSLEKESSLTPIKWEEVNSKLTQLRNESIQFLEQSIWKK